MLLRFAVLAYTVATPFAALAASSPLPDQITACEKEPDDRRLSCFDTIARALHSPAAEAAEATTVPLRKPRTLAEVKNGEQVGQWQAEVSVDAMTDQRSVAFGVTSQPDQTSSGKPARLGLLCTGTNFTLVWVSSIYLGSLGQPAGNVTYRVDAGNPQTTSWNIMKQTAVTNDPASARAFVQSLAAGKRLIFQIRDYEFATHQAVFNIEGLSDVLELFSACSAPPPPMPVAQTLPTLPVQVPTTAPAKVSPGLKPATRPAGSTRHRSSE